MLQSGLASSAALDVSRNLARQIRALWEKIGNSIAAYAQAPKVNFLSTAETLDDQPCAVAFASVTQFVRIKSNLVF
jgi:hypothetical protein